MPSPVAMQYEIASAAATLTELLQIDYREGIPEVLSRYSTGVAKSIPEGRIVNQVGPNDVDGGHMIQVIRSHSDSGRASRDASKDYGRARKPRAGNFKVRFDTLDPAKNDLCRIEHIIELDIFQLKRAAGAPSVAVDIAENQIRNAAMSTDEVVERLFHADETAVIGVVDGGKKLAGERYENAGAYVNGAKSVRIKIKSYSIALFKPGFHLDFHSASAGNAKVIDEVEVMHVDEEEGSILVQTTTLTTLATNVDGIADGLLICRSGEFNQGFKGGLGGTFKTDYTGDSWFGGINRSQADYMWLVPLRTGLTSAPRVMNPDIMDSLANGMSMRFGVDQTKPLQFLGGLKTVNSWRRQSGQGVTSNRDQGNRDLTVGENGLEYVHPEIGRIEIRGSKNARPDRGYLWDPQRFEMLYGEFKGFEWTSGVPGNIFRQIEGRNNQHGGGSIMYRAEGVMFAAPIATEIMSMACAFNLK